MSIHLDFTDTDVPDGFETPARERFLNADDSYAEKYGEVLEEEPMIKTNMGKIPLKDFLDIKASQNGFDDYADMKAHGYMLEEENQYNGPEPTDEVEIINEMAMLGYEQVYIDGFSKDFYFWKPIWEKGTENAIGFAEWKMIPPFIENVNTLRNNYSPAELQERLGGSYKKIAYGAFMDDEIKAALNSFIRAEKITEASISPDRNMKDIKTAEYKHEEIREEPPKPAPEPKPARQKTDAYTRVMEERTKLVQDLIENMKKGYILQPAKWNAQSLRPRNPVSGASYRGINRLRLMMEAENNGYKDPRWVTFNQAKENGWSVKKGAAGTVCEKWEWNKKQPVVDEDGKPVFGKDGKPEMEWIELKRPKVYYFIVFNGEQIHGIPKLPEPSQENLSKSAERMIKSSECPIIECAQDKAFYRPSEDKIYLPLRQSFKDMTSFYNVAFHEMTHSTGHSDRLDRSIMNEFGTPDYAKEELRAELGSMFVAADIGLPLSKEHYQDHSNYFASWIKALENDPNELYKALRDADNASRYLMSGYENYLALEKGVLLQQEGYPCDRETAEAMAKLDLLTGTENSLQSIAASYYQKGAAKNPETENLITKIGDRLHALAAEPVEKTAAPEPMPVLEAEP